MATSIKMQLNGYNYRRYPDSPRRSERAYWVRTAKGGGVRYLHRDVWEAAHGEIPPKSHVHHISGDTLDNRIENLELKGASEHLSDHNNHVTPERAAQRKAHIDAIRPLAAAWHSTPEGFAHHQENARRARAGLVLRTKTCGYCRKNFETVSAEAMFCSNNCKVQDRRLSGKDNVTKPCLGCGVLRTGNRYQLSDWCHDCGRWHPDGPAKHGYTYNPAAHANRQSSVR